MVDTSKLQVKLQDTTISVGFMFNTSCITLENMVTFSSSSS